MKNTEIDTLSVVELDLRRRKVQDLMREKGLEGMVIASNVNLFYLTGKFFTGLLFVPAEGELIVFYRKPNDLTLLVGELHPLVRFAGIAEKIDSKLQSVGFETEELSYSDIEKQKTLFPYLKNIHSASRLMLTARSIKTDWEIEHYRTIAHRHAMMYRSFPSVYRQGMTDLDYQIELEHLMRKSGSEGIVRCYAGKLEFYMGSLLAGENALRPAFNDAALGGGGCSSLPLGACGIPLKSGMTIMADMAGNFSPYQSDITRTFSIGTIPDQAYKLHNLSRKIYQEVIRYARPGVATVDVYDLAMDIVRSHDAEKYFMGYTQQSKFVGHGVGLQINEQPVLAKTKDVLAANMVMACEPKFVLPGVGAVGVENTFLITADGLNETLTWAAPEEIIALG